MRDFQNIFSVWVSQRYIKTYDERFFWKFREPGGKISPMNAAESHFLVLTARLRNDYARIVRAAVAQKPLAPLWDSWRDTLRDVLRWADVATAAKLRHQATGRRLRVPEGRETDLGAIVEANPWIQTHVEVTRQQIDQWADFVRDREVLFVEDRVPQLAETQAIPLHRLTMLYRNGIGQVTAQSEQVALSAPDVDRAFPFAEYITKEDARVRPTHIVMHGFAAARWGEGLEILKVVRPPNGYQCRCGLRFVTWREAYARGWVWQTGNVKKEVRWPNSAAKFNWDHGLFPDPGFDTEKFVAESPEGVLDLHAVG